MVREMRQTEGIVQGDQVDQSDHMILLVNFIYLVCSFVAV